MKKLFSIIFLIAILAIPFNSCKKAQFNELGNVITIKLPSDCSDCVVVMTQNEGYFNEGDYFDDHKYDFDFGHDEYTGSYIFNPYQNGIHNEVTLNIDWNIMDINPHLLLTSHKEIVFYILNTKEDSQGLYVSEYELELAASILDPGHEYYWDTDQDNFRDVTPDTTVSPTPTSILGKWMRTDKNCVNENKEDDYFNFKSGLKGEHFLSDCSNQCSPFGVHFPFTYAIQDTTLEIVYQPSLYYCSQIFTQAEQNVSLSYKRIGDIVTIDGIEYKFQ